MKYFASIALAAALSLAANLKAVPCYALTDANHLLIFDSATPAAVTDQTITGLGAFNLVGMAMRTTTQTIGAANPGVGSLWALGADGASFKLFRISPDATAVTASATAIGGTLTPLSVAAGGVSDSAWGFAFNPAADRFQAVGVFYNFTIDPNTATAVRDANVFTAGSANPAFSGASFTTASFGGTSQFYIVNTGENHNLCTSANIAAGGLISEAGATEWGIGLASTQPSGLAMHEGVTFLAASNGNFYSVNRSTGVASLLGSFPGGTFVRSVVIRPTSFPPALSVTVKIKGKKKIKTTRASLKIKGTAFSESGIKSVRYKVGKHRYKTAKGSTRWSFRARLKPGTNRIRVQATGGNDLASRIAKIKVVRQ